MPRPIKKASKKVGRVVRRTLADGTVKEYRYKAYKPPTSARDARDSVASLVRAYKGSPRWRGLADKTRETYSIYLRPLDAIGQAKVGDVTRRNILEMRDAIAKGDGETSSNGAATSFIRAASAMFTWAVKNDWIERSPIYDIDPLPSTPLPAWTNDHALKALAGLPEHYRRVVVLGLYTGQRRGDLIAATWSAYDGETLTIIQEKTGAVVVLTVPPDLKAELDAWQKDKGDAETILINRFGRPWNAKSLTVHLPKMLQPLGIPKGINMHGMRKLFAAGMANNGATANEIMAKTGHKTMAMVQLYTKSADQQKLSKGAVGKIQSFTINQKTNLSD